MAPPIIENPILNTPFDEPSRHFHFDDEGITSEIVEGRRESGYFLPIASPRKKSGQLKFETEWTQDRFQSSPRINRIRDRVRQWRSGGYVGCTRTTERLLQYWSDPDRERKLFFCQVEALETAIYIAEVAGASTAMPGSRTSCAGSQRGLQRRAASTGLQDGHGRRQDRRDGDAHRLAGAEQARRTVRIGASRDAFLIVTPGITIRDRLRVLLPTDPDNYYRERDIVPADLLAQLGAGAVSSSRTTTPSCRASAGERLAVDEVHSQQRRERVPSSSPPTRWCAACAASWAARSRSSSSERRGAPLLPPQAGERTGDRRRTRRSSEGEAHRRGAPRRSARGRGPGVDLRPGSRASARSASGRSTTCPRRRSFCAAAGIRKGTLFPWVVSDFSLIDAIESGIVKVPRVPVADDAMAGEQPTYRDLWLRIRDDLPKKGRKTERLGGEPKLPVELEGALHQPLPATTSSRSGAGRTERRTRRRAALTPPVFIVVCNNIERLEAGLRLRRRLDEDARRRTAR